MTLDKDKITISTAKSVFALVTTTVTWTFVVASAYFMVKNDINSERQINAQQEKSISELQVDSKYLIRLVERMAERNNIDVERVRKDVESRILTENK